MKCCDLFSQNKKFNMLSAAICCAAHEKGPYAIYGQSRSRSASVQSDLGISCSSTYTSVSIDSVS